MNEQLPLLFGDNFLEHHAGQIIQDAKYAIVELVANSWDAGSTKVDIGYPVREGDSLYIKDDGIGMTLDEFKFRWGNLNYNRILNQGKEVFFPTGKGNRHRIAFGKNGVGRHAMFCFCNEYFVETSKDGIFTRAKVEKSFGDRPFIVTIEETKKRKGHGTLISGKAIRNINIPENSIIELIGSKFVADPEFIISVNNSNVNMTDFSHLAVIKEFEVVGMGKVTVRRFEGERNRTTQHQGVAWWVNNRLVGVPTWDGVNGRLIDGRNPIAKKYVYIIEVDFLKHWVKQDWSGFSASSEVTLTKNEVLNFINDDLLTLLSETRRERKTEAFDANKQVIKALPEHAQNELRELVDQLQQDCPTFGMNELESTVKVLAIMEKSRSGYALLEKLSRYNHNDIDDLNAVLEEWSITDIKRVKHELSWRLDLIYELDKLIDNHTTDELHDLQPLFERGLWIFGPEFDAINFTSNMTLSTIVKKFFGQQAIENARKRADFVILPESSIGTYSRDSFNSSHDIDGIESIVIIELKRGGFEISYSEKDQALGYAREIRRSGKVAKSTRITCYVLGSTIDHNAIDNNDEGNTTVIPMTYNTVMAKAKARTFNLLSKLDSFAEDRGYKMPKEENVLF